MATTSTKGRNHVILTDDPLLTTDAKLLEEILAVSLGHKYLNATQEPPYWRNVGIPSDDASIPINKRLAGGCIVRQRYLVSDIQRHYDELSQ